MLKQDGEKTRFLAVVFTGNRDKIRRLGREKNIYIYISSLVEIPRDIERRERGAVSPGELSWNFSRSNGVTGLFGYIRFLGAKLENLRGPLGRSARARGRKVSKIPGDEEVCASIPMAGCPPLPPSRFPEFSIFETREETCRASRDFSNFHRASQRDLPLTPRARGMHNMRDKNDVRINMTTDGCASNGRRSPSLSSFFFFFFSLRLERSSKTLPRVPGSQEGLPATALSSSLLEKLKYLPG